MKNGLTVDLWSVYTFWRHMVTTVQQFDCYLLKQQCSTWGQCCGWLQPPYYCIWHIIVSLSYQRCCSCLMVFTFVWTIRVQCMPKSRNVQTLYWFFFCRFLSLRQIRNICRWGGRGQVRLVDMIQSHLVLTLQDKRETAVTTRPNSVSRLTRNHGTRRDIS